MTINPPAIGLLRELSPEVPPEVRAQLILGELPEPLRPFSHPVAVLLRERWNERRCDRRDVARGISDGANQNKILRRIDQVLNGEQLLTVWVTRMVAHLSITEAELSAAWSEAAAWEEKIVTFERHRARHQVYARFGPYIRPLPLSDACSQPNANDGKSQSIEDLFEIHGDPDPSELHPWMQEHAHRLIDGKFPIAGWLYLRAPEEMHIFRADGSVLQSGHADLPLPAGMDDADLPLWRNR